MATFTLRSKGSAPVDLAWERYAQPALWSQWSPQVRRVNVAAGRIEPGLEGTVDGYLGVHVRFVILEVDEAARTWLWHVTAGPAHVRLRHEVTDQGRAGSSTTLILSGPAPVLLGYLAPAQLALHRLVRP